MGLVVNRAVKDKIPINLSAEEIKTYKKRFEILDKDKKGFVSITDIRRGLKVSNNVQYIACIDKLKWKFTMKIMIHKYQVKVDRWFTNLCANQSVSDCSLIVCIR